MERRCLLSHGDVIIDLGNVVVSDLCVHDLVEVLAEH